MGSSLRTEAHRAKRKPLPRGGPKTTKVSLKAPGQSFRFLGPVLSPTGTLYRILQSRHPKRDFQRSLQFESPPRCSVCAKLLLSIANPRHQGSSTSPTGITLSENSCKHYARMHKCCVRGPRTSALGSTPFRGAHLA